MKLRAARFLPASLRAAAVLFCACAAFAAAADEDTLTYSSPEVGCDWLDLEYETIKSRARTDISEPPAVTKEGVMMTFGMLLSLPSNLIGGLFRKKQKRPAFSRNPDDIVAAAGQKECAELLQLIEADKRAGKYPPPAKPVGREN